MSDVDKITALEIRVRALEDEVRHLRGARDDDRARLVELATVVRDMQLDLARLSNLPDDVAELRERLKDVEAAIRLRLDALEGRIAKLERRLLGWGAVIVAVVELLGYGLERLTK